MPPNKTTKLISLFIIIAILMPAVFFSAPKKAEATLPTVDWSNIFQSIITASSTTVSSTTGVKTLIIEVLKQILMAMARKMLDQITQNTVNWINSGFHGNPLYIENTDSFFKDIVKYEVKNVMNMYGYDPAKFPFGKDFALNILNSYQNQTEINAQYTLSKVITDQNSLDNYRNNFSVGGWNGFLINTQYPQNNYIGFNMMASEELARRIANPVQNKIQQTQNTLQQGMGFLSPQTCPTNPNYNNGKNEFQQPEFNMAEYVKNNPPPAPEDTAGQSSTTYAGGGTTTTSLSPMDEWTKNLNNAKTVWGINNTCKKPDGTSGLVATTPGSVVANQITGAMGSKGRQGELAAALGNPLSAIFDALINKFMSVGLNALTSKGSPDEGVDVGINLPAVVAGSGTTASDFLGATNALSDQYASDVTSGNYTNPDFSSVPQEYVEGGNGGGSIVPAGGITSIPPDQTLNVDPKWVGTISTAFDSIDKVYLLIYEPYSSDFEVKGQWIGEDGKSQGAPFDIAPGTGPEVTYSKENNAFLVFWTDTDSHTIKGQQIGYQAGSFLAKSAPINLFTKNWFNNSMSATYVPSKNWYLISWWNSDTNAGQTYTRTLSTDGVLGDINTITDPVKSGAYDSPSIDCGPAECLIVGKYYDDTATIVNTWGRWLDLGGKPTSAVFFVAQGGGSNDSATVTYNSKNNFYLVTWSYQEGFPEAAKLTSGSTSTTKFSIFTGTGNSGKEAGLVQVYNPAANEFHIMVVGWDYNIFAVKLDGDGNPLLDRTVINATDGWILHTFTAMATDPVLGSSLMVYKYGNAMIRWKIFDNTGEGTGGGTGGGQTQSAITSSSPSTTINPTTPTESSSTPQTLTQVSSNIELAPSCTVPTVIPGDFALTKLAFDNVNQVYLATPTSSGTKGIFLDKNGNAIGSEFDFTEKPDSGTYWAGWTNVTFGGTASDPAFLVTYVISENGKYLKYGRLIRYKAGEAPAISDKSFIVDINGTWFDSEKSESVWDGQEFIVGSQVKMSTIIPGFSEAVLKPVIHHFSLSGKVTGGVTIGDNLDYESAPAIACSSGGTCLAIGYAGGGPNRTTKGGTWARRFNARTLAPIGNLFYLNNLKEVNQDQDVVYNTKTGKFITSWWRGGYIDFRLVSTNGTMGTLDTTKSFGPTAGDNRLEYNPFTETTLLVMKGEEPMVPPFISAHTNIGHIGLFTVVLGDDGYPIDRNNMRLLTIWDGSMPAWYPAVTANKNNGDWLVMWNLDKVSTYRSALIKGTKGSSITNCSN